MTRHSNLSYDDAVSALLQWEAEEPATHRDARGMREANAAVAGHMLVDCLILLDTDQPESEWKREVVELFECLPVRLRSSTFRLLDEGPGAFRNYTTGPAWHWKLRRTRNDSTYGKRLFEVLAGTHLSNGRPLPWRTPTHQEI
jgi:hypothetical protein